jgi:predicted RND superfamily exporter protein
LDLNWLIRHRKVVIILTVLVTLGCGAGLLELRVSTDNRVFYGPENPYFLDFLEFESRFTTNDNIVFVLNAPYTIQEKDFPQAIRWLTQRAFNLSHVIRVDSLANYPYASVEGDSVSVQSFLDWACPGRGRCETPIGSALEDLRLHNRLVSADHKSAGVIATVSIERGAVGEIEALNAQAVQLISEFKARFPTISTYFTGGVPMMVAFAEATANDLSMLVPLAFAIIFLLLTFVHGSSLLALLLLGIGGISSVIVLGAAGWSGHVVNNVTSNSPVIVLTLVVTSAMHVTVHFATHYFASNGSVSAAEQAVTSTRDNARPIIVSALISAATLASLSLVDSPPLRQLGVLATSGVLVGCVLTLTFLPVCLSMIRRTRQFPLGTAIQRFIDSYSRRVQTSGPPTIPVALLFVAGALGLSQLHVDDDFVRFFDRSVDFRIQTDKVTELLTGPNHIELVVEAPEGSSVFEPKFLMYLDSLANGLRRDPLVANAFSFSDVMQHLSKVFYGKPITSDSTEPELSQLYVIYELSLNAGQSTSDLVSSDHQHARVSVLLKESSSADIQRLESTIRQEHEASRTPFRVKITGENIPVAHLSEMNIKSMLLEIGITLLFASVVLGVLFKSVRLGLIALMATTVPVLVGFGIWGWIAGTVGLAATAIIALTSGVVVDNTAHYLFQYLDARARLGGNPRMAAGEATRKVGSAVVSSSVALGAGLGVLVVSDFQVISIFGSATCLIILLALMFDLAILPRLAIWASPSHQQPELRP